MDEALYSSFLLSHSDESRRPKLWPRIGKKNFRSNATGIEAFTWFRLQGKWNMKIILHSLGALRRFITS